MRVKQDADRALATEIERIAAIVRQTPIEHPPMLDRWPYAPVARANQGWSMPTGLMLGLLVGLCIVVGLVS